MIKIAICDDEKRDRERLQKLVYEFAQKYEQTYEIEIIDYKEVFTFEGAITQDNINEIAKCENLKYLDVIITSEDIDLSPLSNLIYLQKLSITFEGNTADLSFIKELDYLTNVTIKGCCELADLSVFENMKYLQNIFVEYVEDVDLNFLANCKSLNKIHIAGGGIRNVEGISDLTHLKSIYLFDNYRYSQDEERIVLDLHSFSNMTELEWMLLAHINIADVSPLSDLPNLREIVLVKTNIDDIEPLSNLPKLTDLSIYGNKSETVKQEAEMYFNDVENVSVIDEIPNQLQL